MYTWRFRIAVALLVANIAVVAAFWWSGSGHLMSQPFSGGGPLIALGRIAGLLLQVALLVQLLLIGRIPFIERGVGFDRLNRIHRFLGFLLISFVVVHPVLLSYGYAPLREEGPTRSFFGIVRGFDDVPKALAGAILLMAVAALSVPWVRRHLRYESWHAAHLATYLALALSFGHQVESGGDFASRTLYLYWFILNGAVVGVFLSYRFVRPLVLWHQHRFVVDRIVQESPDAWSLYVTGRNMDSFRFEPGQFANLHVLTYGLWAGHPFSFSREYDGASIRFTIKELGDGSSLIRGLRPGAHIIIDGPLGAFTPGRSQTGRYLLIAGGIGVTPLRAIAGSLAPTGADVVSMYAARTGAHTALLGELRRLVPNTHLFLSEEGASLPEGAHRGQVNAEAITELVPDVTRRDVYVCGPKPMMDAVITALRRIGVPPAQIHSERFAY